jgi:hypothetical protein
MFATEQLNVWVRTTVPPPLSAYQFCAEVLLQTYFRVQISRSGLHNRVEAEQRGSITKERVVWWGNVTVLRVRALSSRMWERLLLLCDTETRITKQLVETVSTSREWGRSTAPKWNSVLHKDDIFCKGFTVLASLVKFLHYPWGRKASYHGLYPSYITVHAYIHTYIHIHIIYSHFLLHTHRLKRSWVSITRI